MSDIKKIRDFKKARQPKPEISKTHHKRNVEEMVNLLMPIIEKSAANSAPVFDSFEDLLSELQSGVKRSPVVVNMHDGKRISILDGVTTELKAEPDPNRASVTKPGNASKVDTGTFSDEEMKLLNDIQNSK